MGAVYCKSLIYPPISPILLNIPYQTLSCPLFRIRNITLSIKREDSIHPLISGNKYRKLKYNLEEAKKQGQHTLLTFGGAFSNHIAAVAYAGYSHGLQTIGVIRGEELKKKWQNNPTLRQAHRHGMQFHFVSRSAYSNKESTAFLQQLKASFGEFYLLPEGGSNALAVRGCEEIIAPCDAQFDYICCSVGTGATLAGISNAAQPHQTVLGFTALKSDFVKRDILKFTDNTNWTLVMDYHFGGYAKVSKPLVAFINTFKKKTGIPLEPIYTGKMLFGIVDLVKKVFFARDSRILAIHTGGLQGIQGMNQVLKQKNLPVLDV